MNPKSSRLPRCSKVSKQGQITIPSAIRKAYNIRRGCEILFFPREGGRLELIVWPPASERAGRRVKPENPREDELKAYAREIKRDLERYVAASDDE